MTAAVLVADAPAQVMVLARSPEQWAEVVRADLARSVEGFIAAGHHLAQAKDDLPHGEWLPWIERELPVGRFTVAKLMELARHKVVGNVEHAHHLPPRWDSLYELSRLDPPLLEAAIADGRVTPDLERKQARALVAEYRTRRPTGLTLDGNDTDQQDDDPAAPDVPAGLVSTIVADPPWRYGNTSTRGAAEDHYPTMSIDELCDLTGGDPERDPAVCARERAADRAHLYLWTTAGHLPEAFRVMAAWGFEYKTYLVWVKPQIGMGNYFRVSTELVLFGIRGGLHTNDRALSNWFEAKRTQHSTKPELFHDLVMRASPGPYLEMFSRCYADSQLDGMCRCARHRLGWQVWGDQA